MRDKGRRWKIIALLAVGMAIGVSMTATPAVGHVSGWVHNWNRHIKPRADARYYRKALADARYYNVGETVANATNATNAANATNAVNAGKLDGQEVVAYVHTTAAGNISGNCTYLNHPALNGNSTALVSAIHEWTGTYLDKTLGVYYDGTLGSWCLFLADTTAMPAGHNFRVIAVDPPGLPVTRPAKGAMKARAPGH
jgi:hypothetical protein